MTVAEVGFVDTEKLSPRVTEALGTALTYGEGRTRRDGRTVVQSADVLMALAMRPETTVASRVLRELGVTEKLHTHTLAGITTEQPMPVGDFSLEFAKAMGIAERVAEELGAPQIATEHVLLGLARADCNAGQVLTQLSVTAQAVQDAVQAALRDEPGQRDDGVRKVPDRAELAAHVRRMLDGVLREVDESDNAWPLVMDCERIALLAHAVATLEGNPRDHVVPLFNTAGA